MDACIHVCMYVCMYVCMHTFIHKYISLCLLRKVRKAISHLKNTFPYIARGQLARHRRGQLRQLCISYNTNLSCCLAHNQFAQPFSGQFGCSSEHRSPLRGGECDSLSGTEAPDTPDQCLNPAILQTGTGGQGVH